jgi:hypothetical protein
MRSVLVALAAGLLTSCGVAGPPVPPEYVGVQYTIEQQKRSDIPDAQQHEAATAAQEAEPDPAMQGQDVNLPPLRPVGTR